MSLFQWLKQLFSPDPYEVSAPPGSLFKRLDVRKIEADIGVEQLAKEHGLKNLPYGNSVNPSETEKQIISQFENNFKSSDRVFQSELTSYKGRLISLALRDIKQKLDNLEASMRGRYAQKIAEGKNSMAICKKRIMDALRELEQFKTENKLDRPAHYPESRFFRWSIIIFMVTVESLLNGYFFAKGHELGYSGGVFQAFIISMMNIGSGLGIGWFFARLKNHRMLRLKVLGATATAIYLLGIIAFNLLVAHYRMAFQITPETASADSIKNLFASPLMILDFDSMLLITLGISFSIIALIDGYKMDDAYPFYGAKYRHLDELKDEYREMVRNLIEDLGTIREEADRTLQYLSKDTAYRLAEFNTITVGTNTFIRSFNEHIQFLEDNCNSLLSRYRNVNSLNRTTPPPDYFSQEWRAPCDLPNEPLTAETQSLLTNAQQALKEIQDSAGMTSRRLLRAFRDSIKEFKGLDDLSAQVLEGITNA